MVVAGPGYQIAELARLAVRTRRALPWCLLAAAALAGGAFVYLRSSPVRYASDAYLVMQPTAVFDLPAPGGGVVNRLSDEQRGRAEFLPKPLSAQDYTVLLKSDAVLAQTADVYNQKFNPSPPLTGADVKFGYGLEAISYLEIKTPYEVKYHPTLQLRVVAKTPEQSTRMAQAWAESASAWAQERGAAIREQTYAYVNLEYENAVRRLGELTVKSNELYGAGAGQGPGEGYWRLMADREAQQGVVAALAHARAQAALARANPVPELAVVSTPASASPVGVQTRVGATSAAVGMGSFIVLWGLAMAGVVFGDAVRALKAGE